MDDGSISIIMMGVLEVLLVAEDFFCLIISKQDLSYRCLPNPTLSQLYADSDFSLAILRHMSITVSVSLTSSCPVGPGCLSSV